MTNAALENAPKALPHGWIEQHGGFGLPLSPHASVSGYQFRDFHQWR
jgi:hypothetical protein